ncbi:ATP-dependent RNA helicase DDX54 [Hetaerina americana]|uniref:ATP-dependent RNA helicase DDX54 n=1 Tax=Hetaerina americana TaxID=62018 RepID=UPI003A7F20F5
MVMPGVSVEGFDDNEDESKSGDGTEVYVKKKTSKKCGGFQGMGLSFPVLKGIQKRGYKIPTPIQRKTIPLVLDGRDVVAMARTGSGKTACFLIPLFEKLKARSAKTGARALILSPTRELAIQTNRFIKELGRFLDLKSTVILGGDSMDTQFDALHGNPDIIVATPGRFLHICVEMDLKLDAMEYVVFDEADRLFEMGFGEQLHETLARLPDSRQTLLFSATLPKMLVEFARAGLSDPVLLRLDVDSKIPETLKLGFISCCSEEKPAALLSLLRHIMPEKSQTAVFVPTKHHVDYIYMLLCKAGFNTTYIYSDLDPSARKINAAKFVTGKCQVLVVTDVAARGVDIPCLDIVVNYNFPPKPKLFVHRVGRCARAGRCGVAYSLVTGEERPYLLDLHLFLGRPLILAPKGLTLSGDDEDWKSGTVGRVPREILEEEGIELINWHETSPDLASMKKVCKNAYSQYLRSRPGASTDSVKRAKEAGLGEVGEHPGFFKAAKVDKDGVSGAGGSSIVSFAESTSKSAFLEQVRSYRPSGTVFETGPQSNSGLVTIMREKRQKHDVVVNLHRQKEKERQLQGDNCTIDAKTNELPTSNEEEIKQTFKQVIAPKRKLKDIGRVNKRSRIDKEHYIPYSAPDHHTEQGLAINNFDKDAARFELELGADTDVGLKLRKKIMMWDQRKKKMVSTQENKVKKIKTESGVWIPATYKSGRYNEWKEKSKVDDDEEDDEDEGNNHRGFASSSKGGRRGNNNVWGSRGRGKGRNEMKRPEQILKERKAKELKKGRTSKKGQRGRGGHRGGQRGGSRGRGKGRS